MTTRKKHMLTLTHALIPIKHLQFLTLILICFLYIQYQDQIQLAGI